MKPTAPNFPLSSIGYRYMSSMLLDRGSTTPYGVNGMNIMQIDGKIDVCTLSDSVSLSPASAVAISLPCWHAFADEASESLKPSERRIRESE